MAAASRAVIRLPHNIQVPCNTRQHQVKYGYKFRMHFPRERAAGASSTSRTTSRYYLGRRMASLSHTTRI